MKVLNESERSEGHHFREVRSNMVLAKVSAVDYCKRDHSVETLRKTWQIQSGSINEKVHWIGLADKIKEDVTRKLEIVESIAKNVQRLAR